MITEIVLWKMPKGMSRHGPAFKDRINAVFGDRPDFQYFDSPVVIDNVAKQVHITLDANRSS